jgi:DNA-binding LacI/PurR family transcriptional regulator
VDDGKMNMIRIGHPKLGYITFPEEADYVTQETIDGFIKVFMDSGITPTIEPFELSEPEQ